MFQYEILAYSIHAKTKKVKKKKKHLKHWLQRGMRNLNYQMDHILYQVLKIIFNISSKKDKYTDNSPMRKYM